MKAIFTKRICPKCGGNLYLNNDFSIEGRFISWYEEETCLQCGFIYGAETPPRITVDAVVPEKVKPDEKQLVVV